MAEMTNVGTREKEVYNGSQGQRTAVLSPVRVRFATVAPGIEPWRSETIRFFESIARCGGKLAHSEKVCYFDRVVDRAIVERLHDLEVRTMLIAPVDQRTAMGNNQVMLEPDTGYDWLVACDCDVVIARDFSHELVGDAIALAPVDDTLAPIEAWKAWFEWFGVSLPAARYRGRIHGHVCPPYFNAGVLLVPSHLVRPLRDAWQSWLRRTADAFEAGQVPSAFRSREAFTDQLALALALADTKLPQRALPLAMNCSTHCPIDPELLPHVIDPYVLHYHHRVGPTGTLLDTGYPGIDARIRRLNEMLDGDAAGTTGVRQLEASAVNSNQATAGGASGAGHAR
ncbi:MAG: hypothetical protein ACYDGY_02705 [Acidimicrobiales bacterium]